MENSEQEELDPKYSGLDKVFHPCVDKYGRDMVALVINAGMAGEAMRVLAAFVGKHQSSHSLHALNVLGNAYNALSNYYVVLQKWDEGMIAQCDRDCQLAWAGKIQVPGSALILNS